MELYWMLDNSQATHVKNSVKVTFYKSNSFFVFDSWWNSKKIENPNKQKKVIFPSISDMGCFRVIKNSAQFH